MGRLNTGHVSVLEIGPGGGSAIAFLANSLKATDYKGKDMDVDLALLEAEGIDSSSLNDAILQFNNVGKARLIKGYAQNVKDLIPPESVDIVNTSAVLHEVYSYGGGYSSFYDTLSSISGILKPNGYYAYRDVFSIEGESLHERTIHCYSPQSWVRFLKLFLPYYLSTAEHPYHRLDDGVYLRQNSKSITARTIDCGTDLLIEAPIGVFREVQRHYITLRDHLWRSGVLGITPELEGVGADDWINKKDGHKRVRFSITNEGALTSAQQYLLTAISEESEGKLIVDSDTFDEITDSALGHFLHLVEEEDEVTQKAWNDWLAREGAETYTCMTTGQFIGSTALRSIKEEADHGSVLLPEIVSDVKTISRDYYNRFLRKRLANPLFDGKQQVLFKKTPLSDSESVRRGLEIIQAHCPKNMLSSIYSAINNKV